MSCGGEVQGDVIDFPSNGVNYGNNMDCRWTIKRNYSFYLHFTRFDLERHHNCVWDFLRVNNGTKMCGNETHLVNENKGVVAEADVIFHSDGSVVGKGFRVEIRMLGKRDLLVEV